MAWDILAENVTRMLSTEGAVFEIAEEVRLITADPQEGMDKLVQAFLKGSRYFRDFMEDIQKSLDILIARGAQFSAETLLQFNDQSIEDQVQDFTARAGLLNMFGGMPIVEAVYWEDVMDEKPTKEILLRCLKWFTEN